MNFDHDFDNYTRREELIELMHKLKSEEKNCFSCQGFCCTFEHNSMLVSPIEALDVYRFLESENRIDDKLISRLKEFIRKFRLDNELLVGNGREFRRNYTCPFFNEGPKGCSIAPESKPYGCLGFNALEKGVSKQGHCTSYINVLEARENRCSDKEEQINQAVKENYNLYWDKKNLPVALLHFINFSKK